MCLQSAVIVPQNSTANNDACNNMISPCNVHDMMDAPPDALIVSQRGPYHFACPLLQSDFQDSTTVTFSLKPASSTAEAPSGSMLTIQMIDPGRGGPCPSVEFRKRGALSDDELTVFSAALKAANYITSEAAHVCFWSPVCAKWI